MASDQLVSYVYPYLPIRIGIRGWQVEAMGLLDTGFSAQIIVPTNVLEEEPEFSETPDDYTDARLADGRIIHAPVFLANLEIGSLPPVVGITAIIMGDQYIRGRGIIDRFMVTLDHGDRVIVEP